MVWVRVKYNSRASSEFKKNGPVGKNFALFAKKIRKIVSSALEVKDVEGGDIAAKEVAVEFSDLGSGDLIFIGNDCDFAITIWADNIMSRHSDRKRRARLIKDALRVEGYRCRVILYLCDSACA